MPVHDWSRVEAGLFHHFHHSWIEELQRVLNAKVLPPDYDAMAERAEPKREVWGETEMEFSHRKQTSVTVRHVSGDRVVARIEVGSPGNKR
jgi:hypothetical protein